MTSVKKESNNDEITIYYLEEKCYYGKNCRGFRSGKCPYNHHDLRGKIRSNVKKLPYGFCKFEFNGRCKRKACAFDHLKGKIKFVNGTEKNKLSKDQGTCTENEINKICISCDDISINNELKNDKEDLKVEAKNLEVEKNKNLESKENKIETEEKNVETEEKNVETEENNVETEENNVKTEENKVKTEENKVKTEENNVKTEENNVELKEAKFDDVMKKRVSKNYKYRETNKFNKNKKGKKSKFGKFKSDRRYGFKNLNLDMKSLSEI